MKVIVENQLIEYSDEGSGRVIVMLHGWGQSLSCFSQIANHLSKNFRVIRFDFPGFGNSTMPQGNWGIADYAKITDIFLKKIGVAETYAVIAHSFGGRVTIKAIDKGFMKTQKVVLIGAAGIRPKETLKRNAYKIVAKTGKAVTSLPLVNKFQSKLKKALYASAGSSDYLNSGEMKQIFLNAINEDLSSEVSSITQPTLLLWGENDTETPIKYAKQMNELINGSYLVVIENAGHFVFIEESDKVISELDKFLK